MVQQTKSKKETTVADIICEKLLADGIQVVHTREPGGIAISEDIRNIILDPKNTMMDAVQKVRELESKVDDMRDKLKENHIHRLNEQRCNTKAGVVFFEIISNLERVSDHARNLSDYLD